ncbi:hypothetical protein Q5741_00685 [Paenibacillus sp. JX-17]|uniref:Uncharacterized protein n=1 Tax=Paenibacillus lacisoli TaxID=3064525 RepID=A0ABT9C6N0_9BACL|nr:hypothetical protein [Paenibacillus sp. JX-17]MDO7904924.1 hypothetical protein [Paenibacillus sp. JX-17]
MNIWIFAGMADKSDILLYLSKLVTSSGKRVLLVDATRLGRYQYSIPKLGLFLQITQFAGFDVAEGFQHYNQLSGYLEEQGMRMEEAYDYVLIDLEVEQFADAELFRSAAARVWVSDYGRMQLERGRKWLENQIETGLIERDSPFYSVYVQTVDSQLHNHYLTSYLAKCGIMWHPELTFLPLDESNVALRLENEHNQSLRIKPLSRRYKRELRQLVSRLTGWEERYSRRLWKIAERRQA